MKTETEVIDIKAEEVPPQTEAPKGPPQTRVVCHGVVTKVVDGDTFEARLDLGFKVYTVQRFRLFGIDCPEKDEKSTNWLKEKVANKHVAIESIKSDSFGRWLCILVVMGEKESINKIMVDTGLATLWEKQ